MQNSMIFSFIAHSTVPGCKRANPFRANHLPPDFISLSTSDGFPYKPRKHISPRANEHPHQSRKT